MTDEFDRLIAGSTLVINLFTTAHRGHHLLQLSAHVLIPVFGRHTLVQGLDKVIHRTDEAGEAGAFK